MRKTNLQFLESFNWVDNFGSTDTFVKVVLEKEAKSLKTAETSEVTKEPDSSGEKIEADDPDEPADDGSRNAAPTRSS